MTNESVHAKAKELLVGRKGSSIENGTLLFLNFGCDLTPKPNLLYQIKSLHNKCMPFQEKFQLNHVVKPNRGWPIWHYVTWQSSGRTQEHRKSDRRACVLCNSSGGSETTRQDRLGFTVGESCLPWSQGPIPSRDTWLVAMGTTEDNRCPGPQTGPSVALSSCSESVIHSSEKSKRALGTSCAKKQPHMWIQYLSRRLMRLFVFFHQEWGDSWGFSYPCFLFLDNEGYQQSFL